jgi:hypothetical protein
MLILRQINERKAALAEEFVDFDCARASTGWSKRCGTSSAVDLYFCGLLERHEERAHMASSVWSLKLSNARSNPADMVDEK